MEKLIADWDMDERTGNDRPNTVMFGDRYSLRLSGADPIPQHGIDEDIAERRGVVVRIYDELEKEWVPNGKIITVIVNMDGEDPIPAVIHKNLNEEVCEAMGLPLIEGGYIKNNILRKN